MLCTTMKQASSIVHHKVLLARILKKFVVFFAYERKKLEHVFHILHHVDQMLCKTKKKTFVSFMNFHKDRKFVFTDLWRGMKFHFESRNNGCDAMNASRASVVLITNNRAMWTGLTNACASFFAWRQCPTCHFSRALVNLICRLSILFSSVGAKI